MVDLDLSAAQEVIEDLLRDAGIVWRDPQGSDDDVLDEETGIWAPPDGDLDKIYEGPLKVGHTSEEGDPKDLVSLPLSSPTILKGDWVQITGAYRDPELVGKWFRVQDVQWSTYAVSRKLEVQTVRKP